MYGSPLEAATWNGVEAAYYTGAGGAEMPWLIVSIVCCVLALILGHSHESAAYKDAERKRDD
ncbi:MAG: hypothetical protein AB8B63_14415 [Granulosicoccus sp.]